MVAYFLYFQKIILYSRRLTTPTLLTRRVPTCNIQFIRSFILTAFTCVSYVISENFSSFFKLENSLPSTCFFEHQAYSFLFDCVPYVPFFSSSRKFSGIVVPTTKWWIINAKRSYKAYTLIYDIAKRRCTHLE